MDRLRATLQNLSEQFDAMSERDRLIATGLLVVLAVLFVGGVTYNLHGRVQSEADRVITAKENLVVAQELAAELTALDQQIAAAEARMGEFKPQLISSYLEQWAAKSNVPLKRADETGSQTQGEYIQRTYAVEVQDATLEALVRFLYEIETSPYPLEIRAADFDVKTVRKERSINLSFELNTYAKEAS